MHDKAVKGGGEALDRLFRKKTRTRGAQAYSMQAGKLNHLADSKPVASAPIFRSGSAGNASPPTYHARFSSGNTGAIKRVSDRIQGSFRDKTAELRRIVPKRFYQNAVTHWLSRTFRGIVMCVMVLLSVSLFYLLIIMGDSYDVTGRQNGQPARMESLAQSPLHMEADRLSDVKPYFNAPVMRLSSNSNWKLVDISVLDDQPAGVGMMVREIRLRYRHNDTGAEVDVSSITPSRYLRALPARGFDMAEDGTLVMANIHAMMMSNGDLYHAHAQSGESVYQIEGQVSEADFLSAVATAAFLR